MLNRAKRLSNNNNSWAEEGQEKPKYELVKSERNPTKTILRRTVIQTANKNDKTTMKKSSDRRRPS